MRQGTTLMQIFKAPDVPRKVAAIIVETSASVWTRVSNGVKVRLHTTDMLPIKQNLGYIKKEVSLQSLPLASQLPTPAKGRQAASKGPPSGSASPQEGRCPHAAAAASGSKRPTRFAERHYDLFETNRNCMSSTWMQTSRRQLSLEPSLFFH